MVNEKDLANQLGISRTPVREALQELARSEIVKILPQRGIQISLIDYTYVEEIQFARTPLENAVLDLLCDNDITEKDLKIVADHRQIYEAIVRHDANQAKACMSKHLSRYHVDEKGIRETYPREYFV